MHTWPIGQRMIDSRHYYMMLFWESSDLIDDRDAEQLVTTMEFIAIAYREDLDE